ncbi:MAG: DUF2278 family protein [Mycetocola sp.]
MPLTEYGVLAGQLVRHFRDRPDNQGRWYHVNLEVAAPAGLYRCAVDVDSKSSAVGVQWKVLTVRAGAIAPVASFAPGYQRLASKPNTGAVDHIRHVGLIDRPGCLSRLAAPGWLLSRFPRRPWHSGSNLDASMELESILAIGRRTLVWGEPFNSGLGMHNIHQNQGDPAGSPWWDENGTWQDGAVMIERDDGAFETFVSKFSSQSDQTDDAGHPI